MELAGQLLVASPTLTDPNFFRTVVLVLQHGREGAVGVVLNRPSESPVADHLPRWAPNVCPPEVVFVGGPCEPAVAIGLVHGSPGAEPTGLPDVSIADLEGDATGTVRIFSGYSGWGPGQLEDELDEEAWLVVDATPTDVLSPTPEDLWAQVLRRQRGALRLLATYPPDPILN